VRKRHNGGRFEDAPLGKRTSKRDLKSAVKTFSVCLDHRSGHLAVVCWDNIRQAYSVD